MQFLKQLIFKFMELGLGLRPIFSLETRNPIFVNFKLTPEEAEQVRRSLPPGFALKKFKFCETDETPEYWISYNLYEIKYPKKELAGIKRARCEINTFVEDAKGRKGVHVFSGSPYVSKEESPTLIGRIAEMAERLVIFLYGCGKLVPLTYELNDQSVKIHFKNFSLDHNFRDGRAGSETRLSEAYARYNDISFFNNGKTYDLVNVNSAFTTARLQSIDVADLKHFEMTGPFVSRKPDRVYYHRGDIAYLVSALNRA